MLRVFSPLCRSRRVSRLAAGVAASAALFSAALTAVTATGTAATAATYVAMGDSYTSGPESPPNQALRAVATGPTTTTQVTSPPPSRSP